MTEPLLILAAALLEFFLDLRCLTRVSDQLQRIPIHLLTVSKRIASMLKRLRHIPECTVFHLLKVHPLKLIDFFCIVIFFTCCHKVPLASSCTPVFLQLLIFQYLLVLLLVLALEVLLLS